METKELKIIPPEGFEVDVENSDLSSGIIRFKQKPKRFIDDECIDIEGYIILFDSDIKKVKADNNTPNNYNLFATEKQAKSALAMARISQIMANDERFGGIVTDTEWNSTLVPKYAIFRYRDEIETGPLEGVYEFLTFHTQEQRELFLQENEQLVKDYLMIPDNEQYSR